MHIIGILKKKTHTDTKRSCILHPERSLPDLELWAVRWWWWPLHHCTTPKQCIIVPVTNLSICRVNPELHWLKEDMSKLDFRTNAYMCHKHVFLYLYNLRLQTSGNHHEGQRQSTLLPISYFRQWMNNMWALIRGDWCDADFTDLGASENSQN